MSLNVISRLRSLHFVKLNRNLQNKLIYCSYRSCNAGISKKKKLEDYFFDPNVQSILKRITSLNYDKVFRKSKQEVTREKFEFVTEEKLKQMFEEANAKAIAKLQMPPVMDIREPIDEVLSKDPQLQYYLESKLVFIDTSSSATDRNRIITVREMDGTLRKANWDERFKTNQIFFPIPGRELDTPKLFESPYIDNLLEEESYEFLLDAACAQFEPDDPEYHRVTHATYEHLKSRKQFDVLRSTRHFGPMAFYFAVKRDINPLLVDMLERQLTSDAVETIKLLYILNPELRTSDKEMDDLEYIKDYVEKNKSADLELALQTFLEIQEQPQLENTSA